MRRRTFLSTAIGGTATGLSGCVEGSFGSSETSGGPRLRVDGRWLVDPTDEHVVLRGVNVVDPWWGTEYEDSHRMAYWDTIRMATDDSKGWYPRVIRVPVEPRSIDDVGVEGMAEQYLDRVVELTREQNVYVILDYHTVERYDSTAIDQNVREFWQTIAPRYADEPHVLYELFNEPTEPAADDLDTWLTWRETAQPWVDLVRDRAPATPLLVGSPRWTSMAKYAPEEPFEGDHLVYTAHIFPSWGEASWESTFGAPATAVPMFVSEWGYVNADRENHGAHMIGTTEGYGEPFRQWLDGHENVNWTAWSFSSEWKPYMFDDQWNLLGGDDHMGAFAKKWLADKRTDHQPSDGWTTAGESVSPTGTPAGSPPAAPANLTVTDTGPTAVWLSWDAPSDPDGDEIDGYEVVLDGSSSRLVDGDRTEKKVSGLDTATSYEFTVLAADGPGLSSEPSAAVTATTLDPTEVSATVSRTDARPTVDGAVDEAWAGATAHELDRILVPDLTDFAATWRALWDDEALYWLVEVTDATASTDSEDAYQDDSIEVYLDPDHSRESTYDRTNDANYVIRRDENEVRLGTNSIGDVAGVEAATAEADAGWVAELAVPWSLFEVAPEPGHRLGFDVHANDDDTGDGRDAKLAWYATNDVSWQDPRAFPTVELTE